MSLVCRKMSLWNLNSRGKKVGDETPEPPQIKPN